MLKTEQVKLVLSVIICWRHYFRTPRLTVQLVTITTDVGSAHLLLTSLRFCVFKKVKEVLHISEMCSFNLFNFKFEETHLLTM